MATMDALPQSSGQNGQGPVQPRHRTRRPRRPRNPAPQHDGGVALDGSSQPSTAGDLQMQNTLDAIQAPTPASNAPTVRLQAAAALSGEERRGQRPTSRRPRKQGADAGTAGGRSGQRNGGAEMTGEGSRSNRRPGQTQNRPVATFNGRQFGGQLTNEDTTTAPSTTSSLQASAPEFRPQQTISAPRPAPSGSRRPPPATRQQAAPAARKRRASKSSAADIATRTHEDITNGVYECPICVNELARNSKVWSCKTCWTVFHLNCIKRWSKNEGSAQAQQQLPNGEMPPPRQWRCPGCNLPKDVMPTTYACWCEKEVDPRPYPGLPPHSCGQTCGKVRVLPKACPHPCELVCHAGPCPPCSHMGPTQTCYCGDQKATRRCVDTKYDTGWSCGKPCGEIMPCGEHHCQRECHEGLCGTCEVPVSARCYCGKDERDLPCCDRGDERESRVADDRDGADVINQWTGVFRCTKECGRAFDCGKHYCEKTCHVQDTAPAHCPASPDVVTHCPCGKTPLDVLTDRPRLTCKDPISSCQEKCQKRLPCGHLCQQVCHADECMPCMATIEIPCRCGRVVSSSICHQGSEERPWCMRTCRTNLNCGRHECGERCCPGERKAAERNASKRKARPLDAAPQYVDDGFEAEHICTRTCGRMLKCGNHDCPELCHKGPCGSCREAIFDEISCHCGRTVLQPPLPCGTKPPPCRFDCERRKSCRHPQIPHNCHGDEEQCPKCPFLTEKTCMCGKKMLKNQQCWLVDVRCGEPCGKMLRCGSHNCRKQCHRPGECEDATSPCQQPCGKAKKACGHACEEPCHAPYPCREEKPCTHKDLITCECQHLKQEVRCCASRTSDGNSKKTLKCDDECARLERNRKLALALEIDPATHTDSHIPYSKETLSLFQDAPKWSQTQERIFRVFAADETERRLRFKPMPPAQRAFLHALAEDFGIDSESMDPEPHRHIAIFKTPRFVAAPMKTLSQCVEIRASSATAGGSTTAAATAAGANLSGPPFNAFLLSNPRFGLTISEIHSAFTPSFTSAAPSMSFKINFLPSEEIVIKPSSSSTVSTLQAERTLETSLRALKPALLKANLAAKPPLAASQQLCRADGSLNILRRELDESASGEGVGTGGGWSQVAAKAAVRGARAPEKIAVGGGGGFTVLGRKQVEKKQEAKPKMKKKEKERKKEEVVEDWAMAEEEEELRERGGADAGREGGAGEGEKLSGAMRVESDGKGRENGEDVQPGENEIDALLQKLGMREDVPGEDRGDDGDGAPAPAG